MKKTLCLLVFSALLSPAAYAQSLRDAFRKVSPSVVVIRTLEQDLSPDLADGFVSSAGLGSGVLISDDGKVMTAAHVVQTADVVEVEFMDSTVVPARVVASSVRGDVALLQLDRVPDGAVTARLGNSDKMDVGDDVFVIGAPYGISHSLTVGHISGRRTEPEMFGGISRMEVFQTDAAINKGNSGGPMFNKQGEVVGIVSYILTQSGGFEGIGFVVTSNVAQQLLLAERSFWSGADIVPLAGDLSRIFNVPGPAGLLVQRVAKGSPAEKIGIRGGTLRVTLNDQELLVGGDIVLEVAGIGLASGPDAFKNIEGALSHAQPGATVTTKVLRAGNIIELSSVIPAR